MTGKTKSKTKLLNEVAALRRRVKKLKANEAKLSQERIVLRTLIDNLPDAIYTKDSACRKTLANLVDVHNLGLKSEKQIIGKDDTSFFPPDVAAAFMADDRSVIETGQPVNNREEFFFDGEGKKRWLLTTKLPVINKRNKVIGIIGIGRDITAHRQIEENMERERNLLRALVDNLPDLIYYKDAEGHYILNNRAHLNSLGAAHQEDVLGKTTFDFNPRELAEGYWRDESEIIQSGKPLLDKEEIAVHKRDGNKRMHLTSKIPIYDNAGNALGIVGISRDITDRKCSEEALRREKGLMDALMDSLPDSIYFKDRQCRLLRISRKMLKDLKCDDMSQVVGKTDVDLFGKEFGKKTLEDDLRLMAIGEPIVGLTESRKLDDGSFCWTSTTKVPLWENGQVVGLVGVTREINEVMKTQHELAYQKHYLESLVEGSPIAIITINREQFIETCNGAFKTVFGYTPDEVAGKHLDDFIVPEDKKEEARALTASSFERESINRELLRKRKDGSIIDVELHAKSIYMDGEQVGVIAQYVDITERKRTEEQIRLQLSIIEKQNLELEKARDLAMEASKTKSAFLASMSHELRTPLNAIIGYSEMVMEEMSDARETIYLEDVERIRTAGKHLLSLINDVLDISKIEAGKMELYLEDFELSALIKEVAATIRPLMDKNGNTFVVNFPQEMPTLRLDLTKVRQILFNLISNATKFTQHGTITLTCFANPHSEEGASTIALKVSDTGIGLTKEQQGKLFREFAQADSSTTRKYGGTGLGLAITKRFSEMMHGSIGIESVPNKGTTFTVVLPQRIESTIKAESPASNSGTIPGSSPSESTVVVIDDDPAVRDMLLRYLSKDGYHVECVAGGDEGIKRAKEVLPIAIILDVMMPHKDGWAILQEIKADPCLKSTPVIMYTMVDEKNFGLAIGASEYLIKPVSRETILQVIEKYKRPMTSEYVLVVDDDRDLRELATRTIEKAGCKVFTAENGQSALSMLRTVTPNLIFLDLMMPVMDGFEFLAAFQSHEEWRYIPVVVMTSKDLSSEERFQLSGIVRRIIQKGDLTPEILLRQLSSLIPQLSHILHSNGNDSHG